MQHVPVEHPIRLRSPIQAEALYRNLAEERVGLRGFRTNDGAVVERCVAAIDPACDTTVYFEDGALDGDGWTRLAAIADARPGYVETYAGGAQLRAWPDHAKVYARLLPGGVDAVADALGVAVKAGLNQIGDGGTIAIDPVVGYPLAVAITTPDRAFALRALRALGDTAVPRGLVKRAKEPTKQVLAPFVCGMRATVHVLLDVRIELACELAQAWPELRHDWQSSTVAVEFPTGRIHGYVRSPRKDPDERARWLAKIDAALEGAVRPA